MASYSEIFNKLLSGEEISWGDNKSIRLASLEARRLFKFLSELTEDQVKDLHEELFSDLISAWQNKEDDPVNHIPQEESVEENVSFLLHRVETNNFGGLNSYGGDPFIFEVNGKSWAVEGQNGSGKTSLVRAILWAMTGYSIREHFDSIKDIGKQEPVFGDSGKKIGQWPPLITYPSDKKELENKAELSVRLIFKDRSGNEAIAERKIIRPIGQEPSVEEKIDPQLRTSSSLIEAGLLMPARLRQIGFGERSQTLYEAVKKLTGLDRLGFIGDGAANLTHKGRNFLKYAKDKGAVRIENNFEETYREVIDKAQNVSFALPKNITLDRQDIQSDLQKAVQEARGEASEHTEILGGKIAQSIDLSTSEGRKKVGDAIGAAKQVGREATDKIPIFAALKALNENKGLDRLPSILQEVEQELVEALGWHNKQEGDREFRLKALAAQYFDSTKKPAHCPLCKAELVNEAQKNLAEELKRLRDMSEKAARRLSDACTELHHKLTRAIPESLQSHLKTLFDLEPKQAIVEGARKIFINSHPFSDVLEGVRNDIDQYISNPKRDLPVFTPKAGNGSVDKEPVRLIEEWKYIAGLKYVLELDEWWRENRGQFSNWWEGLASQDKKSVFRASLVSIEESIEKANPLDEVASLLENLKNLANEYQDIQKEQEIRNAIAQAIEPLKQLRDFVDFQAKQSIEELSEKMGEVRKRVHLEETLKYKNISLAVRKQVPVHGSFFDGMKFDASPVANTSWYRAALWAFIFALREKTVEELGYNPFPLLVLDDPQITFDARNEMDWAAELVRLASENYSTQILCSANNHNFNKMLTNRKSSLINQAKMVSVKLGGGKAQVISGNEVERSYQEAIEKGDDEKACDYIYKARSYIENLIKIMLRGLGQEAEKAPLDKLVQSLRNLRAKGQKPFDSSGFNKLLKLFDKEEHRDMMNVAVHERPENISVSQAKQFHEFWKEALMPHLHEAFDSYSHYYSFSGNIRPDNHLENSVRIPTGQAENIRKIIFLRTGIAAAARTDGRAGDGVITIKDLVGDITREVNLHDHEIYRITAETLLPIVGLGDYVIVHNHGEVNPKNLVVAAVDDRLLLRRYNVHENNPGVAILTAQATNPDFIADPVISEIETLSKRKVIGVVFSGKNITSNGNSEIDEVQECEYKNILRGVSLFKVDGQSAEPIALDGQYLIVGSQVLEKEKLEQFKRKPVVVFDKDGTAYFKRLNINNQMIILESLNPDGSHPPVLLGGSEQDSHPQFDKLLPVLGVLFDLPS